MNKPVHFDISEFLRSNTATERRIENVPTYSVIENLTELAINLLDPIREAWKSGIRVSSGYRCVRLNNVVGGVQNSQHIYGCAADIVPSNGDINGFIKFLRAWLPKSGLKWDKCIIETSKSSGAKWVHIVWKSSQGYQRHKLFDLDAK